VEAILSALLFLYSVLVLPVLTPSAPMTGTRHQEKDRLEGYRIVFIATVGASINESTLGGKMANHKEWAPT
jgi:hypothetical protein